MNSSALPRLLPILLLLILLPGVARAQAPTAHAPASAQAPTPAQALTPTQAQQVLEVLQDDRKRTQFITVLQSMAKALPAPAAVLASPAPASPVPAPAPTVAAGPLAAVAAVTGEATPAAPTKPVLPLVPDSLGADLLAGLSTRLTSVSTEVVTTARTVTHFPLLWRWVVHMASDPAARMRMLDAGWKLVLVVGVAGLAEWLTGRALRRPTRALEARTINGRAVRQTSSDPETGPEGDPEGDDPEGDLNGDLEEENEEAANGIATPVAPDLPAPDLPAPDLPTNGGEAVALHPPHRRRPSPWGLLRRMPLVLARLLLDLMPILVFVAVGNGLLGTPIGSPYTTRLVILAVVNAYVICRLVMCFTRMLVSPQNHDLRLVHMSDGTATYIAVWVRRLAVIAVFGYAAAEVGLLFGLYPTAHDAVMKLVSLVVHLCLVVIVLEKRQAVATWIRAAPGRRGAMVMVRNRLARVWHHVAIFYIVALWLVWAFEVEHGFARLLRIFVVTVAVLVAGRLVAIMALGALDRSFRIKPDIASRFPGLEARAHRYHPAVRQVINGAVVAATGVALLQAWGLGALGWFTSGELGGRIVSALVTIGIMLLLSLLVWEATNAAFDRHLGHLSKNAQLSRAARMRTLRPLLRTALLVAICMVTGLTILSEIGVNIAPLLAGAGIVGVAIGFGSQKLVQDLITGLFLLMENAMQVGDWVTVASLSGTVEALSIRTIRLRAGDGSVHIIPFSSVTSVNNTNRGLGNAAVSVNISAREDTDHVGEALKQIALEMREDPTFAKNMLSDLQLWGVDKLDSNMVTMVGQIVCTDSGRWGVQREFNRRMKKRFEELGIEIATPTQTIRLHTDRAVPQAKAGGVAEEPGEAATTRTDSPPPAALGHTE